MSDIVSFGGFKHLPVRDAGKNQLTEYCPSQFILHLRTAIVLPSMHRTWFAKLLYPCVSLSQIPCRQLYWPDIEGKFAFFICLKRRLY